MKVLVLKEKHGEDYFAVPVDKEGVVMLHVIQRRFESGWYDAVDGEEWKLLQRCIKNNDFKAAIKFFRLRRDAEYEGWDLVDAHILPGAQYAYSPLPIQCRARFEELHRQGLKLLETFINGNRKDTLQALLDMEPKAAMAVLTEMMRNASDDVQERLNAFLMEMA